MKQKIEHFKAGGLGLLAAVAATVVIAVPATAKAGPSWPVSARPHTASAATAAFESSKRGQAEQKGLAIARRRHGLPPGVPVPSWALKHGPHVNFTVSPAALRHPHQSPTLGRGALAAFGPKDLKDDPGSPVGPAGGHGGENAEIRAGEVPPIRYLGGIVQHAPKIHLLFWGSNWSGHTSELIKFFQDLSSSSPYQGIFTQYYDSTGYISTEVSVDSFMDQRSTAPGGVNQSSLESEVAFAETIWGHNLETQYIILPAPGSSYDLSFAEGYCAFHDVAPSGAIYSFVPYEGDEPFAHVDNCPWYGRGDAFKATTVLTSHEYAESLTDPLWDTAPGWRNRASSEGEISDICATPGDTLEDGVMAHGQYDDHLGRCTIADANPPRVLGLTEPATNVTETAATINATINPEGSPTTYRFEYGPTTSYGQAIPAEPLSVGAARNDVPVSQRLTGLQTEQVYHYRVVATNGNGTTYGEDHTVIPSKWQVTTPARGPWGESWLNDVSCASEGSCMAVGYYYQEGLSPEPNQALSYQQSGGGWIQRGVPQTEGEAWPELKAVSCPPGGTSCVAVGEGYVSGLQRPLIVRWNGAEWMTEHLTPPPDTLGMELFGVSCLGVQAQECIAVGSVQSSSGVWVNYSAELANGVWSSLATPSGEATTSEATDVDCPTTIASCIAVGWYNPSAGGGARPFSLKMSSLGRWEFQERGWRGYLDGITCRTFAEKTCTAVGTDYGLGPNVETWNGSNWSEPLTTSLPDVRGGYLSGVSCRALGDCTAVGAGWSEIGSAVTLSVGLNGEQWTERTTPRESEVAQNWLESVECAGTSCVAVGTSEASDNYQALVETRGRDKSPTVLTSEPTGEQVVNETGRATLHGQVTPNGLATEYHFEWGTQAEYNKGEYGHVAPVPDKAIGSGETAVAVNEMISPLKGRNTYHYRLVARNALGTTVSLDHSFTTPDWRPGISGEEAKVSASTHETIEAILKAAILAQGFETKYHFEWGTQTEYEKGEYGHKIPVPDQSIGSSVIPTSVRQGPVTGLSTGIVYHFRAVATNVEGTTYGEDVIFHVPAEEVPANISPPELRLMPPYVGKDALVSTGKWTGEHLQYSFSWFSCKVTCEERPSSTEGYIPTTADLGRRLKAAVTATNSLGRTTAYTAESEPVGERLAWYMCQESAAPEYENSGCLKSGSGNAWGWHEWTGRFESRRSGDLVFYWYDGAGDHEIECHNATGSGELHDSSPYLTYNLSLTECSLVSPAGQGCVVYARERGGVIPGERARITVSPLRANATGLNPELRAEPTEGTEIASFIINGCRESQYNGIYSLTGWFPIQVDPGEFYFSHAAVNVEWAASEKGLHLTGGGLYEHLAAAIVLHNEIGGWGWGERGIKFDTHP